MLTPGPGHHAHPCAVPAARHGSAPSEPPPGKPVPAEISETRMRSDMRDLQACSWGLARALASLHKDTRWVLPACGVPGCCTPWERMTASPGMRAQCSSQQLNTMFSSRAERNPPLMLFWNKEPQIPSLQSPLSHQRPFAEAPPPLHGGRGPSGKGQTMVGPNHPCHLLLSPMSLPSGGLHAAAEGIQPKALCAETPTRL